MALARAEIVARIWAGSEPFLSFPRGLYQTDLQGWGQQHHYLPEAIVARDKLVVIEIGVWKGASSIVMASRMRDRGIRGTVICVDTWLGSAEHWIAPDWIPSLGRTFGWPNLYYTFMSNVVSAGLQDHIVPLPADSINASEILRYHGVAADVIHLDAGHDYRSVISDLSAWWPVLKPGGLFIGDYYLDNGDWPGVRQAFDEFFRALHLSRFEYGGGKCRIRKPAR